MNERLTNSEPNLKEVEKLSELLDSKFTVPRTNIKIGLDPILGLIPIVGDILTYLVSAYLIVKMIRHGASGKVAIMMLGNTLLDLIIGMIPIIGTIFDFAYKANDRNVQLLKDYYEEGKHQGSAKGILLTTLFAFMLLVTLLGYWVFKLGLLLYIFIADLF